MTRQRRIQQVRQRKSFSAMLEDASKIDLSMYLEYREENAKDLEREARGQW